MHRLVVRAQVSRSCSISSGWVKSGSNLPLVSRVSDHPLDFDSLTCPRSSCSHLTLWTVNEPIDQFCAKITSPYLFPYPGIDVFTSSSQTWRTPTTSRCSFDLWGAGRANSTSKAASFFLHIFIISFQRTSTRHPNRHPQRPFLPSQTLLFFLFFINRPNKSDL